MKVIAAAYSTKGIREHNEDSFILNTKIGGAGIEDSMAVFESEELPLLFAVADGMGVFACVYPIKRRCGGACVDCRPAAK